ncbi:tat pathway signal sequence protein [Rutstroemia sp. NJR-2017a BVV2]|nr:tat pathway signal sequence protein [Rutstroemia sp. NJR-2017a BVV2]
MGTSSSDELIPTMRSSPQSSLQVANSPQTIREDDRLSYPSFQRASVTSIGALMSRRLPVPPRMSSRMSSHSDHDPPPPYSGFNAVEEAEPEKGVEAWTTNVEDRFARRGGLGRLSLIVLSVLCALGLVLGLALGLTIGRRKSSNNPSEITNTNTITTTPVFPAGNYSIPTFLTTITTNCTSNPATWKCYPYSSYNSNNPSDSSATFQWIITSTSSTSTSSNSSANLTISSTPNPFSILFNNAPLILKDQGMDTERYSFELEMQKQTRPDTQLGEENKAAVCYFDGVLLEGELFTRRGVGEETGTETGMGMGVFVPWAGRVQVRQVVKAGKGVPRCVDGEGGSLGEFGVGVGEGDGNGDEVCECVYVNRVGV